MLGLTIPIAAHDLLLIYFSQATVVVVSLMLIRSLCRRMAGREVHSADESADQGGRPRFALRDLLLLTLVAAIVFAAAADVPAYLWRDSVAIIACGTSLGLMTICAAWLTLGRQPLWLRMSMVIVTVPLVLVVALFAELSDLNVLTFKGSLDDGIVNPLTLGLASATIVGSWLLVSYVADILPGSQYMGRLIRSRPSGGRDIHINRQRAAGCAAMLLSLLIIVPPAVIYYFLITPAPLPSIVLPVPNAYYELASLGDEIPVGRIPSDLTWATRPMLRQFVKNHEKILDDTRTVLVRECQMPFYSLLREPVNDRFSPFRKLAWAFQAEGRLAEMEGRTDDALRSYCNVIQLREAVSRGGVCNDEFMGVAIEKIGQYNVYGLRGAMSPMQRRAAIDELLKVDRNREPIEDIVYRDRVFIERAFGWLGRLYVVLGTLTGEVPFGETLPAHDDAVAKCRLLMCELAIQNYQADHGHAPESLAKLVPDYLPAVPEDPFSGEPLVYRQTPNGYLLYSIGADEHDDGGRPRRRKLGFDPLADILLEREFGNTDESTPPATTPE